MDHSLVVVADSFYISLQICKRESLSAEKSTLSLLSEKTQNDIRSCVNTLQVYIMPSCIEEWVVASIFFREFFWEYWSITVYVFIVQFMTAFACVTVHPQDEGSLAGE